jgi:hypothetical protein
MVNYKTLVYLANVYCIAMLDELLGDIETLNIAQIKICVIVL